MEIPKADLAGIATDFGKVYSFTQALKQQSAHAKSLQYPKIPPEFSESLIVHAIREKKILEHEPFVEVSLGTKKTSDIVGTLPTGPCSIEIKASGPTSFITMRPKDYAAQYLVWVDYGTFKGDLLSTCMIYVLPKPQDTVTDLLTNIFFPSRLTLSEMKRRWAGKYTTITLNTRELLLGQ